MDELRIELEDGRSRFAPGDRIRGIARWRLEEQPEELEIRLFWYTEGKGERDVLVVERVPLGARSREGSEAFAFTAPPAPFSFSGKLISLIWAVELVTLPDGDAGRREITLSRSGEEIRVGSPDAAADDPDRLESS